MSSTRRVFVDFLVERYAGKTGIIAELQTLVGDDPASRLQFSEEFIGNAACKAKEGSSSVLRVNGISLHVEDRGSGKPVLLLHGWPDSSYLWRHQIPFLVANGFRAIAPDLRGIWSSNDHYLDGERMKVSGRFVKGLWRYEQIDDASHWIPLDAP